MEGARTRRDDSRIAQSEAPGCGHHLTFIAQEHPATISTLVAWDPNEIYAAWRASPEPASAMQGDAELWSKPAESERFEMAD